MSTAPRPRELFTSRTALILTALGMAVGTGNIWRFPRILAKTGGGAFIVAWLIFLFAWSIPLIIMELGLGRSTRRGVVGAFAATGGPRWGALGAFVAFCCSAIMFYYAVVAGWCLQYLQLALRGNLVDLAGAPAEEAFVAFANSWWPVPFQVIAMGLAGLVVLQGVVKGIERANKILIPALGVLLLLALVRTLTLPGAWEGVAYVYGVDWALLGEADTWLEALSQSAWSTGAGWGLLLTYGVYLSDKERIVSNAMITGVGNNIASLVAATAIVPAVFALAPVAFGAEALAEAGGVEGLLMAGGPASTGLTFIWIPALFAQMPGGSLFTVLFFLALFAAALSSLIAMVELASRVLMDLGLARKPAVAMVAGAGILLGLPSATSLTVFENQDWVWGLGLMLSGMFVVGVVSRYGVRRWRERALAPDESRWLGRAFDLWVMVGIPAQFIAMLGWWFSQAISWDPDGWWDPRSTFSVGTAVLQWGLALAVFALLSRWLSQRSLADPT